MSNLSNQQINQSFQGLLQVPGGITSTLKTVQDGNGNPTGLQLSSSGASVTTSDTYVASSDGIALTGTVPRLISDGMGDIVSVEDFGAVGNGVADDTAVFQSAIDAIASLGGGTVTFQKRYLIDSNLIIKDGVTLQGPLGLPDELLPGTTADYDAKQGVLIVNSSITITARDSTSLSNCIIIRKSLDLPFPDAATATAGIAAFAGTAITVNGTGTYFHHLLILGFNKAIYSSNYERIRCEYVQGDCTNGIDLRVVYDIAYIENCHFWPWTTVHQTWTTNLLLTRSGTAYAFDSVADWCKFTNCFSYGYNIGFLVNSCNHVTLIGCGADYVPSFTSTSVGFSIAGTSSDTGLISCQAAAQGTAVQINVPQTRTTRIIGCDIWEADSYNVDVQSGRAIIEGCNFNSSLTTYGIAATTATAYFVATGNLFSTITTPFYFYGDNKYKCQIWANKFSDCVDLTGQITTHDNATASWYDYSWSSGGAGLHVRPHSARGSVSAPTANALYDSTFLLTGYGYTGSNYVSMARISYAIDGAPTGTDVPGSIVFSTTQTNTLTNVTVIDKNGNLKPATDNLYNLGLGSNRWSTVYAATGTINTSDERVKTDIQSIDNVIFKAWAKVEYCQYKFVDAVKKKGNGARWHFGCIAQRIKEAFESEGLDAFEYGLLCYDEWESEPETIDEDGVITRAAIEAGNRYGVRYEEALALECAYLRHTLLNKK